LIASPPSLSSCESHLTPSTFGGSNTWRFQTARDDATQPYPRERDVYVRSDQAYPNQDGFYDLGLADFLTAHRRVARRRLDHLELNEFQSGLLSRGAQASFDRREPPNEVLEVSLGYTASCSVAAFDEVASLYERTDHLDGRVQEEAANIVSLEASLRERIRALELRVEVERDLRREATRHVGELRGMVSDLVQTVGTLRDDFTRHVMMGATLTRRATPLGSGEGQRLVGTPAGWFLLGNQFQTARLVRPSRGRRGVGGVRGRLGLQLSPRSWIWLARRRSRQRRGAGRGGDYRGRDPPS
jgi:hypothetical protein